MGLLDGKTALIFGVANDHSIAWGIAQALHGAGAEVGFSSVESLIDKRVRPLAESIGSTFVEPCDVQSDADIERVFERWSATHDGLDILVHALAFAKREDLTGRFVDTSRDGFALAHDVSAYSLVALTRGALPLLHRGSSVLTLTYYGAEKVVANYNVMGVAKAALEVLAFRVRQGVDEDVERIVLLAPQFEDGADLLVGPDVAGDDERRTDRRGERPDALLDQALDR